MLIVEDDAGRHRFVLDGSVYFVGRDANCYIRVQSQFVSRRHATVLRLPNPDGSHFYRIVDGDSQGKRSTNGIIINGKKCISRNLENEDVLIFSGGGKPPVKATYYLLTEGERLQEELPVYTGEQNQATIMVPEITEDTVEGGGRPIA